MRPTRKVETATCPEMEVLYGFCIHSAQGSVHVHVSTVAMIR